MGIKLKKIVFGLGCTALLASTTTQAQIVSQFQGDLVPTTVEGAFNMTNIKNANPVTDLKAVGTGAQDIAGVKYVSGTWESGKYRSHNSAGNIQTIDLHHNFRLLMPATGSGPVNLVVIAMHAPTLAAMSAHDAVIKEHAANGTTAFFLHGQRNDNIATTDWDRLGWNDRSEMTQYPLMEAIAANDPTVVDWQTSNFVYALARTQMLGVTLGTDLLNYFGRSVGDIAVTGGSKEGGANWYVAAADDRVK